MAANGLARRRRVAQKKRIQEELSRKPKLAGANKEVNKSIAHGYKNTIKAGNLE